MIDLRIQNKDMEVNSLNTCPLPLLQGCLWQLGHRASQSVTTLPCSPGPCDQLTFGQEDLDCCLFSSQTIQKEKIDKINKHALKWGLLEMESLLILTVISIYF